MSTNPYFCSVLIGSHGYNSSSILCTRQSYIMVLLLHTIIEIICMWPQNRRVEKTCCWVLLVCNYMSMTLVCLLFSLNLSQIFTIYYLLSPSALGYSSSAAVSPTVAPFLYQYVVCHCFNARDFNAKPRCSFTRRKETLPSFSPPLSLHFHLRYPLISPLHYSLITPLHYPLISPSLIPSFPLPYNLIFPSLISSFFPS